MKFDRQPAPFLYPLFVNGKFLSQSMTGVQRFAKEICLSWLEAGIDFKIAVPKNTPIVDELSKKYIVIGKYQGTKWEQIDLFRFMNQQGGILVNLCNTAPLFYRNNVVTIHDLGVYINASWYSKSFAKWYKFFTPIIVKRAKLVATVSEFSRKQIVDRFAIPEKKIVLIYNGVSQALMSNEVVEKENLILHVGTWLDRKRTDLIFDAFQEASTGDYKLKFIGGQIAHLKNKSVNFQSNKIEFVQNIDDKALKDLYKKAKYIVCASEYEGFGVPVLEGIVNGAVPILSDIPVFKELFSNGSLFFKTGNKQDLKEVLERATASSFQCNQETSNQYFLKYNYKNSANKLWDSVKEIQN